MPLFRRYNTNRAVELIKLRCGLVTERPCGTPFLDRTPRPKTAEEERMVREIERVIERNERDYREAREAKALVDRKALRRRAIEIILAVGTFSAVAFQIMDLPAAFIATVLIFLTVIVLE